MYVCYWNICFIFDFFLLSLGDVYGKSVSVVIISSSSVVDGLSSTEASSTYTALVGLRKIHAKICFFCCWFFFKPHVFSLQLTVAWKSSKHSHYFIPLTFFQKWAKQVRGPDFYSRCTGKCFSAYYCRAFPLVRYFPANQQRSHSALHPLRRLSVTHVPAVSFFLLTTTPHWLASIQRERSAEIQPSTERYVPISRSRQATKCVSVISITINFYDTPSHTITFSRFT